jgi:hypothetical protein
MKAKGKIQKGYLFEYEADIDLLDIDFANLNRYKLIPYLNIYSKVHNPFNINRVLHKIRELETCAELQKLKYKLIKSSEITNPKLLQVRRNSHWQVEIEDAKKSIYRACTTLYYLKYLADKKSTTKHVTKSKDIRKHIRGINGRPIPFEHDPTKQRLVCITDGKSIHRLKQYKADRIVKRFPKTIGFCSKVLYQEMLNNLYHPKDHKPILSIQGSKIKTGSEVGGEIGKVTDGRTRLERRYVYQKHKKFSRYFKSQFVDGKTIHHRIKPEVYTKSWYNPAKRKKAIVYEEIIKPVQKIKISKFPYNKPITVLHKVVGKDDVVTNSITQNVKMLNKQIVRDDPDTKEQVVVCSLKDVEKWCYQEDFRSLDSKEETKWILPVSIETVNKVIRKRPEFHLTPRKQKTKHWLHPIKGVKPI